MSANLALISPATAPHKLATNSITQIMLTVLATLVPATVFGFWLYGWPAVFLWSITVLSALAGEAICLRIARRPAIPVLADGSALVTGWLLVLSLPPWAPWWIGMVGALFAVVFAKQVFGGLGFNLFNPAMVARVALLVSFPVAMTSWVAPSPLFAAQSPGFTEALAITFGGAPDFDAVSSASTLGFVSAGLDGGRSLSELMSETFPVRSLFFGQVPGSLGETSALLLLCGGVLLIVLRIIRWQIPFAVIASVAVLSGMLNLIDPAHFAPPLWHLTSGALMLGAFFIATDYVTSPVSGGGQLLYGAGVGLLVVIIRTWGAFPEGVAFAVLLMNACTPLIDIYTRPRIFGRDRRGKPLEIREGSHQ